MVSAIQHGMSLQIVEVLTVWTHIVPSEIYCTDNPCTVHLFLIYTAQGHEARAYLYRFVSYMLAIYGFLWIFS